jgi:putative transposase
MKTARKSDSQIMQILSQAGSGVPVSELCREHGMSSATFYKWRAKYGGMDTSMITRLKELEAEALSVPLSINQTWSIDFMSDSLNTGRKIRTFNAIDDYNRECLGIEVDHSLPAERVIKSLEQLIEWRGKPKAIRCDNGPEYISYALREWAQAMDIELMYIQPGKPTQNAYIERFNRTARNEWLNMHIFDSIEHAQSLVTQWMWVYNNERPHSSIGGIPPRKPLEAI